MSEPQEQETQPNGKPRGKLSAFFHEHGGTVAAIAGLGAALLTVFVVTRGNGSEARGQSSTTPNTNSSTDGTPISTQTGSTPGQDLSSLTQAISSLSQQETANGTTLQGILGKLTGGSGTQGTPVTRPTPPTPPNTRPLQDTPPMNTSGAKQGKPVKPTNLGTSTKPVVHPSARVEVAVPRAKDTSPKVIAPKPQASVNIGRLRLVAS